MKSGTVITPCGVCGRPGAHLWLRSTPGLEEATQRLAEGAVCGSCDRTVGLRRYGVHPPDDALEIELGRDLAAALAQEHIVPGFVLDESHKGLVLTLRLMATAGTPERTP